MIKNLSLQLNEAGKIKIGMKGAPTTSAGGKEFRLPQKIDHFLLTTTEKDENGDYIIDTPLMDRIKENDSGLVNEDGNLVGVPIRLLYDEIEMNFPTRYACYSSRKLNCYGDGEVSHKRIDDYKKDHSCPCNRLDPDYDGDHKCKANGRLICMIDEAGLFGQAHVFRTTSINSVKGIWGGMELIKIATKGRLAGVPLMLTLTARHTDKGTVYVVSVCFNGTMEALRDSVHALALKEQVYLLDMPKADTIVEPGSEDEQDFVEEFYPDAAAKEIRPDAQGKTETQTPPETNPESEKETPQDQEQAPESKIDIKSRLLKEQGQYASLYNRFIVALHENSREDAFKLAGRLTKDFLEMFFTRERPDVTFRDPKPKKTDYIDRISILLEGDGPLLLETVPGQDRVDENGPEEHPFLAELEAMTDRQQVADAMTEFFHPIPVNRTLDRDGLIAWARKRIGNEQPEKEQPEEKKNEVVQEKAHTQPTDPGNTEPDPVAKLDSKFLFDVESDRVQEDQLRKIVQLKGKLESRGTLQPEEWLVHIRKFTDVNGKPFDTAVNFCFHQAHAFIDMLNEMLPEADRLENIPF